MLDAGRVPIRRVVGRAIEDPLRVEDRQVGVAPHLHPPLAGHLRHDGFEPPGRQQRHLAQGVRQRQRAAVAGVVAEDAGEGAGAARVGAAGAEGDAVAGRDDVGLADDPLVDRFRPAVHDHPPALLPVALERLGGQPLAGADPLQPPVGVAGAAGPAVEQRRFDERGARRVGIRLGRDVEAPLARPPDHRERLFRPRARGAVHVHDVDRRAGDRRVRDHFLEGSERAAAREGGRRTEVDERRRLVLGRDLEHLQQLAVARPRRVAQPEAETDAPRAQAALHEPPQPDQFLVARGAIQRVVAARAQRERPVRVGAGEDAPQGPGPRALVAHRRAVVDERRAAAPPVPAVDGIRPDLELQGRRHAVQRLVPVADRVLSVRVQVDEAGRDHQSPGIDHRGPRQRRPGDRRDRAVPDPDVAHRVEPALRVDDPPPGEHDVERFENGRGGRARRRLAARATERQHGRPGQLPERRPAAPGPTVGHHHHNPSTFHHATPTTSQTARFSTEA